MIVYTNIIFNQHEKEPYRAVLRVIDKEDFFTDKVFDARLVLKDAKKNHDLSAGAFIMPDDVESWTQVEVGFKSVGEAKSFIEKTLVDLKNFLDLYRQIINNEFENTVIL